MQHALATGLVVVCLSNEAPELNLMYAIGTKVLKCKEGMNNKAYILTMDNGTEVLAKLPTPCAGPSFYTTASEVATRTFVSPNSAHDRDCTDLLAA